MLMLDTSLVSFMVALEAQNVEWIRVTLQSGWANIRVGTEIGTLRYYVPVKHVKSPWLIDRNEYLPNN